MLDVRLIYYPSRISLEWADFVINLILITQNESRMSIWETKQKKPVNFVVVDKGMMLYSILNTDAVRKKTLISTHERRAFCERRLLYISNSWNYQNSQFLSRCVDLMCLLLFLPEMIIAPLNIHYTHTHTDIKSGKQQSHCTAHEWRNHYVYRFGAAELRDSFCFYPDYNEIYVASVRVHFHIPSHDHEILIIYSIVDQHEDSRETKMQKKNIYQTWSGCCFSHIKNPFMFWAMSCERSIFEM